MGKKTYVVSGVCCATEESVLRKTLDASVGAGRYTFSLITGELAVPAEAEEASVLRVVRDAGFNARSKERAAEKAPFWERHRHALFAGAAALLAASGIGLEDAGITGLAPKAVLLASILAGGWNIFLKAGKAARARTLDMNVLMTVAVIGAVAIGKWSEGAAVIVLFSVSVMLESYSTSRTRRAVQSLMAMTPEQADVIRQGRELTVPAQTVVPGERIVIRPGQRIPLDGVVEAGMSGVVETMITGESTPVEKVPGAPVYAGSINDRGSLTVRVTRAFTDTTLAHITHLIEEAQHQRAPVQSTIDRFAGRYTAAVLAAALLVAALPPLLLHQPWELWLYRALVMLVIACPCALVISTPVTIVSALTTAARRGMLIKGGRHLETLSRIRAVAFDKTGTLTEGRPRMTGLIPLNSLSRERLLQIIGAIEHRSEHHLASALLAEAARSNIDYAHVALEQFEALPGRGVKATIDGVTYFLGNARLCEEQGFCSRDVQQRLALVARKGETAIVLGTKSEALCLITLRDTARHQSRSAVEQLRRLGVDRMVMLSGDHAAAVQQLAGELGMDHQEAGMLPADKVEAVRRLKEQYTTVAMVGDGINDAPALAAASVGVAMGTNGTDTALNTADVVLMADDLSLLPVLLRLSRKAMIVIRQNITFALAVKLVFLVLSAAGIATLWMAVLADDGAALLVILNGMRLLSLNNDLL